jgi:hypothetical protein
MEKNSAWLEQLKNVEEHISEKIHNLEESRNSWQNWALMFHNICVSSLPGNLVEKLEFIKEFEEFCAREPESAWRPIEEFNGDMFTLMTNGTPDCTEVVKYKGEIPSWALWWKPLPQLPK